MGLSAEFPDANAADGVEVLAVPGDESEAMLERRGRNERIGQPSPELPNDSSGPLGDGSVDVKLAERRKQSSREIGRRVSGEQLGTRDDGVAEAVTLRP